MSANSLTSIFTSQSFGGAFQGASQMLLISLSSILLSIMILLIPFIAKGLTNKEIANHFCLSEQTVKNHLYRMKHKIGADDRLSIVQRFRKEGFLL